jgi:hypothetical protein
MHRPVCSIKLLGKVWLLKWVSRLKGKWGDIDPPDQRGRAIRISREAKGRRLLIVLIHEMLHGCFWQIDEDVIDQSSIDIGDALWRLGFRRVIDSSYDDTAKDPE